MPDLAKKHLDLAETLLEVLETTPARQKKIEIIADIFKFMIEGGNTATINGLRIKTDDALEALQQYKVIESL